VRIRESKRSFARGELIQVIARGAARITPPCPYLGQKGQSPCGGCPWQHVTIEAQLSAKEEIVQRALAHSGVEVRPIRRAPQALEYRTRARMLGRRGMIGFSARRAHAIVPIENCIALEPLLDRAMQAARHVLAGWIGEDGTLSGWCAGDRVQLSVEAGAHANHKKLRGAAASLLGHEGIVGVLIRGQAPLGESLVEEAGHLSSAAGFQQANRAQNDELRRLVKTAAAAQGARVLELYAGDQRQIAGEITVAGGGVAVEGDTAACARLRRNVNDPRWSIRAQSARLALDELGAAHASFDVMVLDPPRSGAAEAIDGITQLSPKRVVYVSCDPMTLARDLKRLAVAGFHARVAWPIDMMPQTSHIEVVCLLTRG
jgi:23S rRNA (uracil1939-C5)-methyltransferase